MWSDHESQCDYLNFSETVSNLVKLLGNSNLLPVSIGIYGSWGTGKSTLLNLIEKNINTENTIIIRYDAWLFQNFDDAKASMMEIIAEAIKNNLQENQKKSDKFVSWIKRIDYDDVQVSFL